MFPPVVFTSVCGMARVPPFSISTKGKWHSGHLDGHGAGGLWILSDSEESLMWHRLTLSHLNYFSFQTCSVTSELHATVYAAAPAWKVFTHLLLDPPSLVNSLLGL